MRAPGPLVSARCAPVRLPKQESVFALPSDCRLNAYAIRRRQVRKSAAGDDVRIPAENQRVTYSFRRSPRTIPGISSATNRGPKRDRGCDEAKDADRQLNPLGFVVGFHVRSFRTHHHESAPRAIAP